MFWFNMVEGVMFGFMSKQIAECTLISPFHSRGIFFKQTSSGFTINALNIISFFIINNLIKKMNIIYDKSELKIKKA